MCALVRLDAPASTASVRLDVLVLGWNRQNRTGRKFEQPSHDTADQHADESTASAGPGDDKISVYLASELSDCLSRTTRLKQRKLYRYSVLLEVLDLSLQSRRDRIRAFLGDPDGLWNDGVSRPSQGCGDHAHVNDDQLGVVRLRNALRRR